MSERPGVGLAVVLRRSDTVLLGRRKSEHGEGTWGFPGGHLEYSETWAECAKRECQEETGLTPENVRFWTATNDFFASGKHYVTLFMVADSFDGKARVLEPEKCEEWRWIKWSDLPPNIFLPIHNLIKDGYNPFTI